MKNRLKPPMSVPGLFVPTYGKSEAAGQDSAAKQKKASRVLPSKPIAPQPRTKASSLPSLVFNGNIEYIQVCSYTPFLHLFTFAVCHSFSFAIVFGSGEPATPPLKFKFSRKNSRQICKFKFERRFTGGQQFIFMSYSH